MPPETPELVVQVPGDPAATAVAQADGSAPAADDANAGRIAELETMLAQQAAMISQLSAAAASVATVPAAVPPALGERRIIGQDWSTKTAAEAHAEGVKSTVLCSDGYYVPVV